MMAQDESGVISLPVGREVLQFQVQFSDRKKVSYDLEKELRWTEDSLNKDLIENPTRFAWMATLHAVALSYRDELKQGLDVFYAELDSQYRIDAQHRGEKTTENSLRALVLMDQRYQQRQEQYMKALSDERILKVGREAFEQRAQMLMTFAANKRAEFDTRIRMGKKDVEEIMGSGPGHRPPPKPPAPPGRARRGR